MTAVDTEGRDSRDAEDLDDEEAVVDIESTEDGDDVMLGEMEDSPRVVEQSQVSSLAYRNFFFCSNDTTLKIERSHSLCAVEGA